MEPPGGDPRGRRSLGVFMGGLDLTDGRWDTPAHNLYGTSESLHKDDWYQNMSPKGSVTNTCRQPWHDIHGYIRGPVCWDVLLNFESRWSKQVSK
eukprot:NODE_11979_length_395_cov_2.242775_g10836_i0.p3 GENE.NODE_11979_length_395_cov_2.242775_g10836_i0~~NODE_11979_length_395_cov_2.242775_g10836_i0.p3  ORF type:complete len:95 (+),score=13.89 NODE_11979_length_395_cov_2.242775_g10836_i0:2-286(+)